VGLVLRRVQHIGNAMTLFFLLILGLVLLIAGGEFLVRSAVGLARRLGVPPLLIGLTIVALGTSAPELMVAVEASLKGVPDIVTGGVIGSSIANILLVLGASALITPIAAQMRMINRDGLFLIGVSAFIAGLALTGSITLLAGIGMICAYVLYVAYSYWSERLVITPVEATHKDAASHTDDDEDMTGIPKRYFTIIPMLCLGLGGVLWGAELLVDAATEIARAFGVSEAVIGLTIVAVGTSLPELAASIIAALRGRPEITLGNVVGSNITNILLVLGVSGSISPVPIAPQIASFDVWVMLAATVVLVPVLVSGQRLSRVEAALFLACYAIYTTALYAGWPQYFVELLG